MALATGITKRVTNHSARRTLIATLKHKNVHPLDICQITGHSNPKSLDHYSEMSTNQQANVSHLISNRATAGSSQISAKASPGDALVPRQSYSPQMPYLWPSSTAMPPQNVYNHCTFYAAPPTTASETPLPASPPPAKRRRIIYSSDEE